MDADESGLGFGNVALDQSQMVTAINQGAIEVELELAKCRGELNFLLLLHQPLPGPAESHQILNAAHLEFVLPPELLKFGQPCHGAIRIQNLAEHTGRLQPSQTRKIHARFRVAGPLEHAPGFCAERKNMARLHKIFRAGFRVCEDPDGFGAVMRADSCGDALGGVHRHGEIGAVTFPVLDHHALQGQLFGAFLSDRGTDEAAPVHCHEINGCRGDFFRRHHQVALVLPVGIVGNHNHAAGADLLEDFFDGVKSWVLWHAR